MRLLLFITLLIANTLVSAQPSIDSLTQELSTTTEDSLAYPIIVDIAIAYEKVDSDSTFYYYTRAAELTKKNNWHKKTGHIYFNLSIYSHFTLWSDTCFTFVKEAGLWYKRANYETGVLNSLFTEGTYWSNFEQLDSTIKYLEQAVDYGLIINDTVHLHKVYNNLGLAYQYIGEYDKATKYMLLTIKEKEKYSPNDIVSAYINLGVSYLDTENSKEAIKYSKLGYLESVKNNYPLGRGLALKNTGMAFALDSIFDSSFYYYKLAKLEFLANNDSNHVARYYMSTSEILEVQGLFEQASDSIQMALKYFPLNGSPRLKVHILTRKCNYNLDKNPSHNELKKIEKMALEANKLAQESGFQIDISKTAKILFDVYARLNVNDLAVEYATAYMNIQDSLFNEQQSEALAEQRIKFETEKKEIEIELLNKENLIQSSEIAQNNLLQEKQQTIIYLLILGVIITLVSIGVILKLNRKQKESNAELNEKNTLISVQKEEKEILLKEIHHRVKNNLQIIWSLLDLQAHGISDEKIKVAINDGKNRVNSMAMIHTMLYQNEDAGNISFFEYVQKLVSHIKSTYTNMGKVDVKIQIPSDLKFDIDTSIPLGLIVTELFTNALKYGVKDIEKGVVLLSVSSKGNNQYEMIISDNGPGLPLDFDPKKSTSLGLLLVPNLCRQVNGTFEMNHNNGAEFVIHFKGKSFTIA